MQALNVGQWQTSRAPFAPRRRLARHRPPRTSPIVRCSRIERRHLVDAFTQRVRFLRAGAPPTPAERLTPEAWQKLDSARRALGSER